MTVVCEASGRAVKGNRREARALERAMFTDALERLPDVRNGSTDYESAVRGLRNALAYVEATVELAVLTPPLAHLDRYFHALALTNRWPRYCEARGWPVIVHQPTVEVSLADVAGVDAVRDRAARSLGQAFDPLLWPSPDDYSNKHSSGTCVPRMGTCVPRCTGDESDAALLNFGVDIGVEGALMAQVNRDLGLPASATLDEACSYLFAVASAESPLVPA